MAHREDRLAKRSSKKVSIARRSWRAMREGELHLMRNFVEKHLSAKPSRLARSLE
jgi:succinate dehydrogenase flavin-adding protein (antitoxin of CptAB toxin-antitoxin module)